MGYYDQRIILLGDILRMGCFLWDILIGDILVGDLLQGINCYQPPIDISPFIYHNYHIIPLIATKFSDHPYTAKNFVDF